MRRYVGIILFLFCFNLFAAIIPTKASLKMVRFEKVTDGSGLGQFDLKIPGTTGASDQRFIAGGRGWFETHHNKDFVKMSMVDKDNVLGFGSGATVGTFYDSDVPVSEQGWYIPPTGVLQVDNLTNLVSLIGGLYLRIESQTGDNATDTFRGNIIWGVPE